MIRKLVLALLGVCLLVVVAFAGADEPNLDDPAPDRHGVSGMTKEELQARMRQDVIFMAFVPRLFEENLKRARENFVRRANRTGFRQSFEDAVAWYRQLQERDPEAVYEEAKIHWARYESCVAAGEPYCNALETIAENVARIAGERGHLEARFDLAQRSIEEDIHDPDLLVRNPYLHAAGMRRLANEDYLPAQLDLAERHYGGFRVRRDLRLAWYWYARARKNGADVRAQLADLETTLTAEDIRAVDWCFRLDSTCDGWGEYVQCLDVGRCPRDE